MQFEVFRKLQPGEQVSVAQVKRLFLKITFSYFFQIDGKDKKKLFDESSSFKVLYLNYQPS